MDFCAIMSRPTAEELKLVEGFEKRYNFMPNSVMDVFKNRRGRWNMIRIWSYSDLGTCRKYDLFATTADMKPLDDFQIMEFVEDKSPELIDLENFYNDGLVSDKIEDTLVTNSEKTSETMLESINKAFGNADDRAKYYESIPFEDLV